MLMCRWKLLRIQAKSHLAAKKMSERQNSEFYLNIGGMRAKYNDKHNIFMEDDLVSKDPLLQFKKWMEDAAKSSDILEPNAMCLATADRNGRPSARYVLLKGYGTNGFEFFTNYNSKKGKDLAENPQAALTFYWEPLKRSVRIEGNVEKINEAESCVYFNSRPKESQISAVASQQSAVVASRDAMLGKLAETTEMNGSGDIQKPPYWGGFRVIPNSIEFWQGQSNRFHDRIRFRTLNADETISDGTHLGENKWVYERLYP